MGIIVGGFQCPVRRTPLISRFFRGDRRRDAGNQITLAPISVIVTGRDDYQSGTAVRLP